MLLGYNHEGEIKFVFTDEKYLEEKYPNNTAKISNFWGTINHGLMEFFVPINVFQDWDNVKNYKIVNGNLTKKNEEEIKKVRQQLPIEKNILTKDITNNLEVTTSNIEISKKGKNN